MSNKIKDIPIADIEHFLITGVDKNNKRFSIRVNSYTEACMYNIWKGSVWAVLSSGKKKRIKQVCN